MGRNFLWGIIVGAILVVALFFFVSERAVSPTAEPTAAPSASSTLSSPRQSPARGDLIGENNNYGVYFATMTVSEDGEATGTVSVYDKKTKDYAAIDGLFSIFGTTIVYDDGAGKYIILSNGTYVLRDTDIISLAQRKAAVQSFCALGDKFLFWGDYLLSQTCDTFANRPWGAGEAPGIDAVNLKTGSVTHLYQSDNLQQFTLGSVNGNTLTVTRTSVARSADWGTPNLQQGSQKIYDLTKLQ